MVLLFAGCNCLCSVACVYDNWICYKNSITNLVVVLNRFYVSDVSVKVIATWKNAIEKNGIEGFNTLSPGGWSSSAASHFGVSSIPHYVLIDKNGNVADPDAKRPSTGQEVINDIVRLIKQ